jgi:hypothetical protein
MAKTGEFFLPNEADVIDACSYKGQTSAAAAKALRSGHFSRVTKIMVPMGIENQWQPSTVEAKHRYVSKFLSFIIFNFSSRSSWFKSVLPECIVGLGSFGGQSNSGFSQASNFAFLCLR